MNVCSWMIDAYSWLMNEFSWLMNVCSLLMNVCNILKKFALEVKRNLACSVYKNPLYQSYFMLFMPLWPRPARGVGCSGYPYIRTSVCPSIWRPEIFGQSRISRFINGSKLIFQMRIYPYETSTNTQEPWPLDLYFMVHWLRTLARLSRLRCLAKVESQDIFMVASWYYEDVSLWDQQEYTRALTSWPIFHGPLTSYFCQIVKIKMFGQGRISRHIYGSRLILWGCISMSPAGIYKSLDLLTYISRSTNFRLWPDCQG